MVFQILKVKTPEPNNSQVDLTTEGDSGFGVVIVGRERKLRSKFEKGLSL